MAKQKLILDKDTGLISLDASLTKDITWQIREYTYKTKNKPVLVYYKQGIHTKNLDEIGDNMTVFKLLDRDQDIVPKIDTTGLIMGMSVYQEFDEGIGEHIAYLYKFPKQNIDNFNQILKILWVNLYKVGHYDNFVILDGKTYTYPEINAKLTSTAQLLSFLFGMGLIYWDVDVDEKGIKSVKIHVPMIQNAQLGLDVFDTIINRLADKGFWVKAKQIQKNMWIQYQIVIQDREILSSFQNFLSGILDIEKNLKYDKMEQCKQLLKDFIQSNDDISNKQEFINKLDTQVLKLLTK